MPQLRAAVTCDGGERVSPAAVLVRREEEAPRKLDLRLALERLAEFLSGFWPGLEGFLERLLLRDSSCERLRPCDFHDGLRELGPVVESADVEREVDIADLEREPRLAGDERLDSARRERLLGRNARIVFDRRLLHEGALDRVLGWEDDHDARTANALVGSHQPGRAWAGRVELEVVEIEAQIDEVLTA